MGESCENCRFWKKWEVAYADYEGEGYCRWKPESINKAADEWCGEWQGHPVTVSQGRADIALDAIERMITPTEWVCTDPRCPFCEGGSNETP